MCQFENESGLLNFQIFKFANFQIILGCKSKKLFEMSKFWIIAALAQFLKTIRTGKKTIMRMVIMVIRLFKRTMREIQ